MATDEELLGASASTHSSRTSSRSRYRLMTRLELATPRPARGATRRGVTGSVSIFGGHCAEAFAPAAIRSVARRRRRVVRRRLVLLCDISGSMEPYARAYLQFLTCAAGSGPNAEAFVFATRLTLDARPLLATRIAPSRPPPKQRRTGRAGPGSARRSRRSTTGTDDAGWHAAPWS